MTLLLLINTFHKLTPHEVNVNGRNIIQRRKYHNRIRIYSGLR